MSRWPPIVRVLALAALVFAETAVAGRADARARDDAPPAAPGPHLATAHPAERLALDRLRVADAWPRRALAAVRLERYRCGPSRMLLVGLLDDEAWQVRCYAVRSLGVRGETATADWFDDEADPRVLRAALRHRFPYDTTRLRRGVETLAKSDRLDERLLAAELAAASGDAELETLAREITRSIILRMDRAQAGALAGRLGRLTGEHRLYRPHRWQNWLRKQGRGFHVGPAYASTEASVLATLDPELFAALEQYLETLGTRHVDLAICLDCTASMSGELAAAQSGVDDLVSFVGDVVASLRLGLVAYRDERDRSFRTHGLDFTTDLDEARRALWRLSAEGGGDTREAVHQGLKLAYTRLSWNRDHDKVLILIGDAPPHVGYGRQCVDLAERAAAGGVTTHVIQADGKDVDHLPEIAAAGGGRCVALEDDALLIAEIAGLTLGGRFADELREFFAMYLDLCR